jgi:hypothetical protein
MAHYIVVLSLCQVFCKQTTTKIVWYVRCNQCFIDYFIYRSGIIDETELAELQNLQISLNHIITSRKFFF